MPITRRIVPMLLVAAGTHVFRDTAIVSARTLGMRKEGGREVPNRVRHIRVFARRGGEWRAVLQMATPAQEPPTQEP
jgi:hypothetical protein